MNTYQKALKERQQQYLLRHLPLPPEGIDFYSNDYLGLARDSLTKSAIEQEVLKAGASTGSTGSRLLSGNSEYAEQIERQIATFHKAEAALVYPTGYMANLGMISSLATKETTLVMDELIHASLIDGARLGRSERVRFKHNDLKDLETKVSKVKGQKIVVVESVYSMDGDVCPLEELVRICEMHEALLIVDEAHAIGIYGNHGSGLVQELKLQDRVLARIMTYGKAPGIHGAAVVGPQWLKSYQTNFSRSLIFSTAPAPHQFASIAGFYAALPEFDTLRNQLAEVVKYFNVKRKEHNGSWLESESQIQSLIIPGNDHVIDVAKKLQESGINALPIRKPSIPEGLERIRFCLHSYNTKQEIDLLFDTLT